MKTIIKGCENWVKYHKGEKLLLEFSAVEELLAMLKTQDEDIHNLSEVIKNLLQQMEEMKMIYGDCQLVGELVRCQDCRFYDVWTLDPPRGNCTLHHRLRIASWFCADGKKRG